MKSSKLERQWKPVLVLFYCPPEDPQRLLLESFSEFVQAQGPRVSICAMQNAGHLPSSLYNWIIQSPSHSSRQAWGTWYYTNNMSWGSNSDTLLWLEWSLWESKLFLSGFCASMLVCIVHAGEVQVPPIISEIQVALFAANLSQAGPLPLESAAVPTIFLERLKKLILRCDLNTNCILLAHIFEHLVPNW